MEPNFPRNETKENICNCFLRKQKKEGPMQGNMNLNLYLTHKITCIHFLTKQKREKKKEITGTHFLTKKKRENKIKLLAPIS